MTSPRILSTREIASRAEAETLPHVTLRTHVPREALEIGALPPRLSTFRPPMLSLSGLARDGGHPTRPAGRGERETPRHRPSVSAPEGTLHFSPPASPRDAEAMRRLGRDLLRMRPASGSVPHIGSRAEPTATPVAADRPSLSDCRRDLSAFRGAMAEFQRLRYFGGEDRHVEAAAALNRAQAAYDRLYASLPLTPSMSGILDSLNGRLEASRGELTAMTPTRRSHRHA